MRSESGAAHRARKMEGRDDARSARGGTRAPLRAGDEVCARERGQGHGPNVEVNRRAQRVRLNLVLGLCGDCGAYGLAANDAGAMRCQEAVTLVLEANRVLSEEELGGVQVIREQLKLTA